MADHPRHADIEDTVGVGAEREHTSRRPWGTYAFVFIALVLTVGFVVLHLTGVLGPGAH